MTPLCALCPLWFKSGDFRMGKDGVEYCFIV
jgi:hypothetical protein